MLGDQDPTHSLLCAVHGGRIEEVREVIFRFGLSYSEAWSEGYVLLCDALQTKHPAIAKLLLISGSKVNSKNKKPSDTPLHFAVINGDIEIVKLILDAGAKIDAINRSGRTPLHTAIEMEKMQVAELLLMHGADVNCMCTATCVLTQGYTPLHFAVTGNSKKIVTLLLSRRDVIVDFKAEDNITPLHIAAKKGYTRVAEDLLNHGADIHSLTLKEEYTPLHFASKLGYEETVKLFLNRGADINVITKSNLTPLHVATQYGKNIVVRLLVQHGAKIDTPYKDGETVLHLAVGNLSLMLIQDLLEYGCIVDSKIANNHDLLHTAVARGFLTIVEALLKHGADVNVLNNSLKEDFTPLHCAAYYKEEEITKLLISYGADINAQDKTGKPPIFYAIENADLKITKLLLTNRANVKDNPELLNIAVVKECIEIVEALLEYNANVNSGVDTTPLHISAHRGNKEISKMLLNKGVNVNAKQKNGITALHIATQKGHKEIVKVLLECGAKVDCKSESDITPLYLGAQRGHQEVIEIILKFGADINSRDNYGRTALHVASQEGHVKVAEALKRHIVKMKTANLYVSEKNLLSLSSSDEISDFQDECKEEIASMKSEKINNANISFYDIFAKGTSSLAICMRNENIVQVLKSDDYKTKFPIYASMIESHFRKGMERKEFLEQGNKIFYFLFNNFPELPYDCTEKIFSYLSDEDLRILMDACKPLSISNPNTNINDVVITSNISQVQYV